MRRRKPGRGKVSPRENGRAGINLTVLLAFKKRQGLSSLCAPRGLVLARVGSDSRARLLDTLRFGLSGIFTIAPVTKRTHCCVTRILCFPRALMMSSCGDSGNQPSLIQSPGTISKALSEHGPQARSSGLLFPHKPMLSTHTGGESPG